MICSQHLKYGCGNNRKVEIVLRKILIKKIEMETNNNSNTNQDKPGLGKNVLITGATSGIGYELARLFARDGYNLVIVARTQDHLQKTADLLQSEYDVTV